MSHLRTCAIGQMSWYASWDVAFAYMKRPTQCRDNGPSSGGFHAKFLFILYLKDAP